MSTDGENSKIYYTAEEDLAEITNKDKNVEVIGYIESLFSPAEVGKGKKKYLLFKMILSNGTNKIPLLIWGPELIKKYEKEMTMNRIVHLERAVSKLSNVNFRNDDAMIPYNLMIEESTIVNFLGVHGDVSPEEVIEPKNVDFLGTVGITVPVVIQGYVKTIFTLITHKSGTSSWGTGAITDGQYKINVQIAQFVGSDIEKGTKIKLKGDIKSTEPPITVHCTDMSSIRVLPNELPMPKEKLIRGVRTPRRPLADTTNEKIVEQSPKKASYDTLDKMDVDKSPNKTFYGTPEKMDMNKSI